MRSIFKKVLRVKGSWSDNTVGGVLCMWQPGFDPGSPEHDRE